MVCVFEHQLLATAAWLGVGAVADFLDGAVARLLNVKSALGKQLDSLADMVSFGVAPGVILYSFLAGNTSEGLTIKALPAFLITITACFRLAKFNIDPRQSYSFMGLPTPACTLFVVGLLLIRQFDSFGWNVIIENSIFIYSCIIILSYLMISELPMFSFKFERYTWQGNEIKIIFAILSVVLLIIFREAAPSLIIIIYVLTSFAITLFRKRGIRF